MAAQQQEAAPPVTGGLKLDRAALKASGMARGAAEGLGRVLIVGGADGPGAAILAGEAALRAGARSLRITASDVHAATLAAAIPEARVLRIAPIGAGDLARGATAEVIDAAGGVDAVVIGPGMADDPAASQLTTRLLQRAPNEACFVVAGGALEALRTARDRPRAAASRLIAMPTPREMAALSGWTLATVLADPVGVARETALRLQAVVILHSADSYVVIPDGQAWAHRSGAPGLDTIGAGDVLSGVVAGLLAGGSPPLQAALLAVVARGEAGARLGGEVGARGFLARELAARIPAALAAL